MKIHFLFLLTLTVLSCFPKIAFEKNGVEDSELNKLSQKFLEQIKNGESTEVIRSKFESLSIEEAELILDNDQKRLAFWINIYNGYIQHILSNNPELYEDRGSFFRSPRINILGRTFSFGEIEHGIIRHSQNEFGLGYLTKWFPPKWQRQLRVKERDYRIHFALNCGAKDCPPVAIYKPTEIQDQLNSITKQYLANTTEVLNNTEKVRVTSLFSWFRGDFGGKSKIDDILKKHEIIPPNSSPSVEFKDYNWTLYLNNYTEL